MQTIIMDYSFPGINYLFLAFTFASTLFCPTYSPSPTLGVHHTHHDMNISSRLEVSQAMSTKAHISVKNLSEVTIYNCPTFADYIRLGTARKAWIWCLDILGVC